MTCIVGYVENGNVWIGGDGVSSSGYFEFRGAEKGHKVFKRKDILFGVSGGCRQSDLLKHTLVIPDRLENHTDDNYFYNSFIPAMIKCFKDNDAIKVKDSEASGDIGILIGYQGKLYTMGPHFSAVRIGYNYFAHGSGREVALGALYVLNHENCPGQLTPEKKIMLALEAATEFKPGVGPPFNILSLK